MTSSPFSTAPKLATIKCMECHTACDVTFGPKGPGHFPLRCSCGEPIPNEVVMVANIVLAQQETIEMARMLGAVVAAAAGAAHIDPKMARLWDVTLTAMTEVLDNSTMSRPLAAFTHSIMMATEGRRDE